MIHDWHRRVESWLEATVETDCAEPPAKRARYQIDETVAHDTQYARHTPPPTDDAASMEQPRTPVRKRGIEQVARDVDVDADADADADGMCLLPIHSSALLFSR